MSGVYFVFLVTAYLKMDWNALSVHTHAKNATLVQIPAVRDV